MAVSITYNSQSLANQISRISFQRDKAQAVLSVEFAPAAGDVETVVAALKKWDKTLVISSGGWSQTYKLNDTSGAIGYVTCRTSVEKAGSVLDSSGRKRLRFTAIIELQSVDDDGFRDWSAICETDVQGRKTVTITGIVTGQGSTSAQDNFDTNIASIEGAFLTLYGGTYEQPVTLQEDVDRHNGRFRFTRVHAELLETVNQYSDPGGGLAENRDSDIRFVNWDIRRTRVLDRGRNHPHVSFYTVSWSAVLAKGKTGFTAQYDGALRALVIKRLKAQFGVSSKLVLRQDDVTYSSTRQSAGATWTARVVGGSTISYVETLRTPFKLADYDKVMSGNDFEVEPYSPGLIGEVIQKVEHITQDAAPPIPPAPVIAGLLADAKLVMLEMDPEWSSTNVGKAEGANNEVTAEAVDHTLKYTARFVIRKRPSVTDVESVPQGARGKPSKAVYG